MMKPLIIATVAVSLATGFAVAASKTTRPSIPRTRSTGFAAAAPQQRAVVLPSPGLYSATPYSGLVLVPKSVDPAFVMVPAARPELDRCIINPHVQLVPRK